MSDSTAPAPPNATYVPFGGQQCYRHPLQLDGVRFYGFVLNADQTALQALCDRLLNVPSGGAVEYVPLVPAVLLGFADIANAHSTLPPDSDMGCMTEVDVAFWVPIAKIKRVGPATMVESISWLLPYVFVNNAWAMASGREIYGFAKEIGDFVLPSQPQHPANFQVSTLLIPKFGPTSPIQNARLLEVQRLGAGEFGTPEVIWHDLKTAFEEAFKLIGIEEHHVVLPGLGLMVELYDFLVHHEVPLTFLKQFRDVNDGTRACHQSVVTALARILAFRGGGPIPGQYALSILPCDSHPIAKDLGLAGNDVDVRSGWFVDFDFVMETGKEIWRA